MISFEIEVATRSGGSCRFRLDSLSDTTAVADSGVRLELTGPPPCRVALTPPPGDRILSAAYVLCVPLRNFHETIVPDTGRGYSQQTQLVGFWGSRQASRINNVRMPLYVLTGQDHRPGLAFGVIGANVETDFVVREPAQRRALSAWMKRLTLEIRRGTDEFPLPDSAFDADGRLVEHLYVLEEPGHDTWVHTLRDFSGHLARLRELAPRCPDTALEPYWCSWTDWFSGDVTEEVILGNVREGVALGIRNFIIDDGWFGPGLDSDRDVQLNIGDWREDSAKIADLRGLVEQIHAAGARAILWCAPHAVGPKADCLPRRRKLLIREADGGLLMTRNGFHSLCFQCPEARRAMGELCAGIIKRYGADGAKYDLFNCVPDGPCCSREHQHDTPSPIEGLARTLAEIDALTRAVRPDCITELKQNYATPHLYAHGSVVRAGDTPYNAEGNFLRTAYIQAYTPFALNDYETITNDDSPEAAAAMIVKMLAVGAPAYSMDLCALRNEHKAVIRFLHGWYARHVGDLRSRRAPLDTELRTWRVEGRETDLYFVFDTESRLALPALRPAEVAVGTFAGRVELHLPREAGAQVIVESPSGRDERGRRDEARRLSVEARPGEIIHLRFD